MGRTRESRSIMLVKSNGCRGKEGESSSIMLGRTVSVGRKRESRSIMLGRCSGSREKERESP